MENLPQRIQIKRKRDQPAPESLYLQPEYEGSSPKGAKRVLTENAAFMFKRVNLDLPRSGLFAPQALNSQKEAQNGSYRPTTPPKTRRFHLTRPHVQNPGSTQMTMSRKRRRNEDDLAVFMERPISPPSSSPAIEPSPAQKMDLPDNAPRLKRPSTRALRPSPSSSRPTTPPKTVSNDTMSALEAMVNKAVLEDSSPSPIRKPLKYKPIVPQQRKPREPYTPTPIPIPTLANPEPHKNFNSDSMDLDDASDYVVETYIRYPVTSTDPVPRDIGLLVIGQKEEDVWETYLDNELTSSDEECASDEEDSNAEDWHGADYPDEEDSEEEKELRDSDDEVSDSDDEKEYLYGEDDEDGPRDWREKWR